MGFEAPTSFLISDRDEMDGNLYRTIPSQS